MGGGSSEELRGHLSAAATVEPQLPASLPLIRERIQPFWRKKNLPFFLIFYIWLSLKFFHDQINIWWQLEAVDMKDIRHKEHMHTHTHIIYIYNVCVCINHKTNKQELVTKTSTYSNYEPEYFGDFRIFVNFLYSLYK